MATIKLVRNMEGTIYTPELGVNSLTKGIDGQVGQGDFFTVFGLTVIQQDFSKVEASTTLSKPIRFGILHTKNKRMVEIEIDK